MRTRSVAWLFGALSLCLCPAAASAQTAAETAARRVLIDQAGAARAAGDHARALELAERAGRLAMSPSLRMFIAEEQQALGHFAPALGSADLCVRETERDTSVRNRDAILNHCRALLNELRTHVGYVTLRIPDHHPSDLRVTVGTEVVAEALYGVPYVVTPGSLTVDASGTGVQPFHREMTVAPGASLDLDVPLVPAAVVASSAPPPSSGGPSANVASSSSPPPLRGTLAPVRPPPSGVVAYGPYLLGGFGVLALGASVGFFLARNSAASGCTVTQTEILCPDAVTGARAMSAPTFNAVADISLGVGAAAIVGGVVWFIANRFSHAPAETRRTTLLVFPSTDGVSVTFQRGF